MPDYLKAKMIRFERGRRTLPLLVAVGVVRPLEGGGGRRGVGFRPFLGRRLLHSAIGLPLLFAGCADESTSVPRASGTVRMTERLGRIAAEVEPWEHPYVTSVRLDSARKLAPPVEPTQRIAFEARLAEEELHVGRIEEAIARLEKLLEGLQEDGQRVPPELTLRVISGLGTAQLRLWERDNCTRGRSVGPCLFPIESPGPPPDPASADAARAATTIYGSLLGLRPGDLTARWLLNLSYMMAGEYPEGVPASLLIPPEAFRSEADVGRFPEIAAELGLDVSGHLGGAIMDDFDGDGRLDIVVSSWHLGDQLRLFRNEGDGSFTERTAAAGLEGVVGGIHLVQADYDNDGRLDLLVVRGAWTPYGEPNSLLRNRADGTFEDVTEEAGLLSSYPTQSASWGDYDNDGWLDLYVGNESAGDRRIPNQLFHNNGDGTFTDVAARTGTDVVGFVKAVLWGDVDGDGDLDLFLSRLHEPNLLLRNQGPDAEGRWRFADVTAEAGVAEPITSFPAWFWDYDNDGRLDLFVSGYRGTPGDVAAEYLGLPHAGEPPRLYHNTGEGRFANVTAAARLERVLLTMGSNFGDLDNDGFEDFYAGTGEANLQTIVPNRMFRNEGGRRFQDVTSSGGFGHLGKGHGVAFGDLDNDGDQDIYATMGGAYEGDLARNVLFENPGTGHRWLTLRLEGSRANRSAIGARIRVVVRTGSGTREIHRTVGSGGSFGANSLQEEIGLGAAQAVEAVEILWPGSGTRERFEDVSMDRIYRIREGEGEPRPVTAEPFRLGGAARR
ncbi:MAG: CRTAC1 family protein [Gemmatimonadota bacterium]